MTNDPLISIVRRIPVAGVDPSTLLEREWLLTNGMGGYASASIAGLATRKYHGLLVAALANPLGRMVMLNHLVESVQLASGASHQFSGEEHVGRRLNLPGIEYLRDFYLEGGLPVWKFAFGDTVLEKRIIMPHRQNTIVISYRHLDGGAPLRLDLRPALHFRHYEDDVKPTQQAHYRLTLGNTYEISSDDFDKSLRLQLWGKQVSFGQDECDFSELNYRVEEDRGYGHVGLLWSPGVFSVDLAPGETASLVASTESLETMLALTPDEYCVAEQERRRQLLRMAAPAARSGSAAELVLAADQFVVLPVGRRHDAVRAVAEGDEIRSVIAGYHWFTDWGRDTMISFEGLTLTTGRTREAASILRAFARYVREGLLPNMFPDGSNEGLYHTADATLWFFHAVDRYHSATGDDAMLERLLPTLKDIARHHIEGTRFGIGVDPADGLLRQGAEGYQLTWMDAKCDGWVVTPRRGKAVEINALWYNALCVLAQYTRRMEGEAAAAIWESHAARTRESFNRRFWYTAGGYLYDVVDGLPGNDGLQSGSTDSGGDSIECRPNQIFAISLPNPVLDQERWDSVMRVVGERLFTPYGLRTLAPGSQRYAPRYFGVLRERDAAYHQGTVWAWLIGPWMDAMRKHAGDPAVVQRQLDALVNHLSDFGIGSIAEIFDAEAPYTPRGCIAQAWSVAEVLRQLVASETSAIKPKEHA